MFFRAENEKDASMIGEKTQLFLRGFRSRKILLISEMSKLGKIKGEIQIKLSSEFISYVYLLTISIF